MSFLVTKNWLVIITWIQHLLISSIFNNIYYRNVLKSCNNTKKLIALNKSKAFNINITKNKIQKIDFKIGVYQI